MKLQYVGNGKADPQTTEPFGYKFELNGAPVEVTDAKALSKLKANPAFKMHGVKDAEIVEEKPAPQPKPEADKTAKGKK